MLECLIVEIEFPSNLTLEDWHSTSESIAFKKRVSYTLAVTFTE